MNRIMPPQFFRRALLSLISERDQESIDGDLIEAYAERRNQSSVISANLWYALQVFSLGACTFMAHKTATALVLLCCFTALCGGWLGMMGLLHHHANLAYHETISGLIVGQALLTLLSLPLRRWILLKCFALLGTFGVSYLGASALWFTLRGSDMEGYIVIIAMLLLVQSALTWQVLTRPSNSRVA